MEDPKEEKESPELKEELSDEELKGVTGGAKIDDLGPVQLPGLGENEGIVAEMTQ